jgi:CRISPR-associated Csx2 family protein
MAKVLVSLLGKSRLDKTTGYRKARYRFDADFSQDTPFFGLALQAFVRPGRMIVLGTAGSIWDVFVEHQADNGAILEEARLKLMEAVQRETVDQALLDEVSPLIESHLGLPVKCLLIPYAKNTEEQVDILRQLAASIRPDERVVLDVTHGFRHLPMLSLVAAHYLERVKGNSIDEIYYGALEMTPPAGETPVLKLTGLLRLMDWVQALAAYEKDGDYGVFAGLLRQEGMSQADAGQIEKAAFFERTTNPVKARQILSSVHATIENLQTPIASLFKEELAKRIRWFRQPCRDENERELAAAYLGRKDYLRAALYLQEAYISKAARLQHAEVNDFEARDELRVKAKDNPHFRELTRLRNALAHGMQPDDRNTLADMQDEAKLRRALEEIGKHLFG